MLRLGLIRLRRIKNGERGWEGMEGGDRVIRCRIIFRRRLVGGMRVRGIEGRL